MRIGVDFIHHGVTHNTDEFINKPIDKLEGHQLFAKALIAFYKNTESLATILNALDRFLHSSDAVGHSFFYASTVASLIAARNGFNEKADKFIGLWGQGYLKYWNNYSLSYLMRDRSTAQLLLQGKLAPVFKLTEEICQKESLEIIKRLSERLLKGRSLAYNNLSLQEILKQISLRAIEQKTFDFSKEAIELKWLGRQPALELEIQKTEKRLATNLPEDYKDFLRVTNGFECISIISPKLAVIEKVDFLVNVDSQLVEIWTDTMNDIDNLYNKKFRNSIIIGGHEEEQQILLVPLDKNEWECWSFMAGGGCGETKYPSFRYYLEEQLQRLEDGFYAD